MTYLVRSSTAWRIARDAAVTFVLLLAVMTLTGRPGCINCAGRFGDFLSLSAEAGERTKDVVSDLPGTAASLALVATPRQHGMPPPVFRHTNAHVATLLLAAVLSLLLAFNLAFVRHLRRVNASPRRGSDGGGA